EEAAGASADIARQQHASGTMNDLAFDTERALAAQASLDRKRAEGDASVARENLNKKMGAWGHRTAWRLPARLPELPAEEPPLERLEARAVGQRLDIAAARRS